MRGGVKSRPLRKKTASRRTPQRKPTLTHRKQEALPDALLEAARKHGEQDKLVKTCRSHKLLESPLPVVLGEEFRLTADTKL